MNVYTHIRKCGAYIRRLARPVSLPMALQSMVRRCSVKLTVIPSRARSFHVSSFKRDTLAGSCVRGSDWHRLEVYEA